MNRIITVLLITSAFGCGSNVIDNVPPPLPCAPSPELAAPHFEARFGGAEQDRVFRLLVAPDGSIVMSGAYEGTPDYGLGPLPDRGNNGLFLMKLSADGEPLWQRSYLLNGLESGFYTAMASDGGIGIGVWFSGSFNLGEVSYTATGGDEIAIARLDADGDLLWSRHYEGEGSALLRSLAFDQHDGFVLAGQLSGTLELDSGPLMSTNSHELFLARIDAGGMPQWGRSYASVLSARARVDPAGGLVVSGGFSDTLDLGAGPVSTAGPGGIGGDQDVFVARFDDDGNAQWTARYGGPGQDFGAALIDAQSRIFLTGQFSGTADIGGVSLSSEGDSDIMLARLNESGTAQWALGLSGPGNALYPRATPDGSGGLLIAGSFEETLAVGDTVLTATPAEGTAVDAFLARFDAAGEPLYSHRFGCEGHERIQSVAAQGSSDVIVAGTFDSGINLGGELMTSAGLSDIFLGRLQP